MSVDHDDVDGGAHDARHEELLAAVLSGDLALDEAPARELARCPLCSARLQRLQRLTGLLDAAGRESRETLDEALVAPAPRARRARRFLPLVLAFAALLIVFATVVPLRGCGTREPDGDQTLGTAPDRDGFAPSGEVPSGVPWGPFEW